MKPLKKIFIFFILAVFFFTLGYLGGKPAENSSTLSNCTQKTQPTNNNETPLSISYFNDYQGIWGKAPSAGTVTPIWEAIDSKYNARSVPSEIKHPPDIKKESIKLVPFERNQIKNPSTQVDESITKYGNLLGGYFASHDEMIYFNRAFDVDKDGLKEGVIVTAFIGTNHPPHKGYIVKNNTVILSMSLDSGDIEQATDDNGFYLRTTIRDDDNQGFCCPNGYRLYRIIFEKGEFKPVWEQEVKYIKVKD